MKVKPLVRQICAKYSTLIEQPNFRVQNPFDEVFDKEACITASKKETYCEPNNEAFVHLKRKQKIALEYLDETYTEFKFNAAVENMDLKGTVSVYN